MDSTSQLSPAPTFGQFLLFAYRSELSYPFIYLLFETIIPVSFPPALSDKATYSVTPSTGALYIILDLAMKLVPYWFLLIYHFSVGSPNRLLSGLVYSRRPLFGNGRLADREDDGDDLEGDEEDDNPESGQVDSDQSIVDVEFSMEELEALLLLIIWTQVLRLDAHYHPLSSNVLIHPWVAVAFVLIVKYFNVVSFFIFWRVVLEY